MEEAVFLRLWSGFGVDPDEARIEVAIEQLSVITEAMDVKRERERKGEDNGRFLVRENVTTG